VIVAAIVLVFGDQALDGGLAAREDHQTRQSCLLDRGTLMNAAAIKELLLGQSLRPEIVGVGGEIRLVPGFTTDKFKDSMVPPKPHAQGFRELPLDELVKLIEAMIEAAKEERWAIIGRFTFGYDGIQLIIEGPNCTVSCSADLTIKQVPAYVACLPEVANFGQKIKDAMR
jgi:hypothetical protein